MVVMMVMIVPTPVMVVVMMMVIISTPVMVVVMMVVMVVMVILSQLHLAIGFCVKPSIVGNKSFGSIGDRRQ